MERERPGREVRSVIAPLPLHARAGAAASPGPGSFFYVLRVQHSAPFEEVRQHNTVTLTTTQGHYPDKHHRAIQLDGCQQLAVKVADIPEAEIAAEG